MLLGWEGPETTCDVTGKTAEQMTSCKSEKNVIKLIVRMAVGGQCQVGVLTLGLTATVSDSSCGYS